MLSCTVCGRPPAAAYEVSIRGEATCESHAVVERCVFCGRPRSRTCAGWSRFTAGAARCPTCAGCAVDTQEQARAHIPAVRQEMAAAGITLATRVRVELHDIDQADAGLRLGVTHSREWLNGRPSDVLGIEIARGLPDINFGLTLAHEIGHAWLVQNDATNLEPALAEGVCELFAAAWLKRRGTLVALALRDSLATNPDPVYGGGYRMVRAVVVKHGIADVLTHIRDHGSLP